MEHGHDIRKIGLVITHKQHIPVWQGPDHLRPVDLKFIEAFVTLVRHKAEDADDPFLDKQNMTEWILFKHRHSLQNYKIRITTPFLSNPESH